MTPDIPSPHDVRWVLFLVKAGRVTVRWAALWLDWTIEDVCMAVWGRVVL